MSIKNLFVALALVVTISTTSLSFIPSANANVFPSGLVTK